MVETGHFASLWVKLANRLGINAELIETNWRRGADTEKIVERLLSDKAAKIKAVCIVHNETSTGSMSDVFKVRKCIDDVGHNALLMVDTISSLASSEFCHDDWGVDVTISGSQKGLMLPPGLSFNAISKKHWMPTRRLPCQNLTGIGRAYRLKFCRSFSIYACNQFAVWSQ